MKKIRNMIALLCTGLLLAALPGCSGGSAGGSEQPDGTQNGSGPVTESAKGRYLETELTLPETISTIIGVRKCADDSIVLFGYDENYVGLYRECSTNQGKDWEETALNVDGQAQQYTMAAINEDGSAALFGYFLSEDDRDILLAAPDGSTQTLTIQLPEYHGALEDTSNWVLSAAYADGRLFVTDFNDIVYEVNTTSGELKEFSQSISEEIDGVLPLGSKLVLLTKNGVRLADVRDGSLLAEDGDLQKLLGTMETGTDTPLYEAALTIGENEDGLYFANNSGIFYHKLGGSTTEQLANGELMSIGDQSVAFRGLFYFDDEHFLVFVVDSLGKERCYSYAYDPNASAVPEKQLNVYALEDSILLQQAISMYQKNHPDVFVRKTIGMSGDDSVTAEDAIKTLNTEIMAGNGPDVLVLDGLPVDSYVEKGILSDINGLVEEANQKEGLFTNITDAYKKDGALYQVPLRFFCTGAEWNEGSAELSGGPKQLAEQAKALAGQDTPVLAQLPAEMLLYAFYDAYSPSWKTDAGIDAEALKESLEAAKTLYDLDGFKEEERVPYRSVNSDVLYQGQIYYGTLTAGSTSRVMGAAQASIGTLCGVDNIRDLYGMESSKAGHFGLLSSGEQKVFGSFICLGLAESAKDSEMAQDFIRSSLSSEGQSQMTRLFSINKKAYENECNDQKSYSIGGSDENGDMFGYEVKPLTEEQIQSLTAMLESLNTPMWDDRVVQELVIDEGKKYLQNEQSLEDAVSAITQKVQLYVSE